MRLIVVDDDRLVVDSLKIILGAQPQIEVVGTGANGNDAVALYAEHAPDIALLDIQMPLMNGYETTAAIRAQTLHGGQTIPIVAMTANAFAEDVVLSRNAGMNDHIAKPLDLNKLKRGWAQAEPILDLYLQRQAGA